ncbi:DUF1672 family protein [Bacillus salacetis]|uniref:DUF1672 family protein n=1 Tax=Bacillus salacetis TaxID=2315464 RepID=A0A3A1R1S1_9BACI|nr:DUF1672 family protein [Bacillus salacetis]RIW32535.1 DUF1672 family protein [Bacillus salacetis]
MNRKNKWIIFGIGLSLLLGGCMDNGVDKKQAEVKHQYARVQDYKGEGYFLNNGDENDQIAEAKRDEVENAVKGFFLKEYKAEVKVHNLVGNVDGVTVFVESTGPVHFYSYAIVPINQGMEEIMTKEVRTQEGEVERGIREGLYRLIFEEEFKNLDAYLEKVVSEEDVVGRTVESLQNVGGSGSMTPYYSMSSLKSDDAIKPVYNLYMEDHETAGTILKKAYDGDSFDPDSLRINIMLFMEEENVGPSEEIMKRVVKEIKEMSALPKGTYRVAINDNGVHKESFEGFKDNSIEQEMIRNE